MTSRAHVAAVYKLVSLRSKGVFRLSPTFLRAAVSVCCTMPTLCPLDNSLRRSASAAGRVAAAYFFKWISRRCSGIIASVKLRWGKQAIPSSLAAICNTIGSVFLEAVRHNTHPGVVIEELNFVADFDHEQHARVVFLQFQDLPESKLLADV